MFITKIEKSTINLIWKHKRPQIAMAIMSKKSIAGVSQYPNSKYTTGL
jgi:hypothetical protein